MGDTIDALLPAEMAAKAEALGVKKAALGWQKTVGLGVLGGAFISLGGVFSTVASTGAGALPFGLARVLSGTVFSLGLVLVVVGGAELFTGNMLIVMAWASRKVSLRALVRNWALVYLGNLAGALGTAALVFASGHYRLGQGAVGATALAIAEGKLGSSWLEVVCLGVLANALVCLAVWLSLSARSTADRILALVPAVACFVAAGFEHSIANAYFFPAAMLVQRLAPADFWAAIGSSPAAHGALTPGAFLLGNLLPATLGNIVGGGLLVGATYWVIYLRK